MRLEEEREGASFLRQTLTRMSTRKVETDDSVWLTQSEKDQLLDDMDDESKALQILLATPWAVLAILNERAPPEPARRSAVDRNSDGAPLTGLSEKAKMLVREVVGPLAIDDVRHKVEEVRSKQFRFELATLWKALDVTLADSTIPVMRLRTELLGNGLKMCYTSQPSHRFGDRGWYTGD